MNLEEILNEKQKKFNDEIISDIIINQNANNKFKKFMMKFIIQLIQEFYFIYGIIY